MNSIVDTLLSEAGLEAREADACLRTRVLKIGRKEAEALLKSNTDNRKLRPGRVKFYAKTMSEGEWKLTHQGIAFTKTGLGVDLQHRLNAVIESGVEIEMMVTEGLSEDAFIAIDQHERRSMSDALKIPRKLSEEAKLFIRLLGGQLAQNPTLAQVGEMSSEIQSDSDYLRQTCGTSRKIMSSVPMRCAAILTMIESPRIRDVVANTYRDLVLHNTEHWTKTMHAFGRQVVGGDVRTTSHKDRIDLFSRGLIVFNPTKSALSKIQINDNRIALDEQRVRSIFGDAIYSEAA